MWAHSRFSTSWIISSPIWLAPLISYIVRLQTFETTLLGKCLNVFVVAFSYIIKLVLPSRIARAVLIDTYPPSLVSVHIVFSLQGDGISFDTTHTCTTSIAHHCIHQDHHRSYCFNVHQHGGCFPFSFVNFLKETMSAAKAAKLHVDQFGTANYNIANLLQPTEGVRYDIGASIYYIRPPI